MSFLQIRYYGVVVAVIFCAALLMPSSLAFAQQPCAVSPAVGGVPVLPNVLLLVDNSGSMLWAAFPNAYNDSTVYQGFFESDKRYYYSSSNRYFYENTSGSWSGNFLNWACLTRWDVQRQVLTGHKYEDISGNRYLVPNPDNRYYDSSFSRWYSDPDGVTPYSSGTGRRYRPVPVYYADDYDGSITDTGSPWNLWPYLEVYDGDDDRDFYYLRIRVASDYEPQGLLHKLEDRVRLGILHLNGEDGGHIRQYVEKLDASKLASVVADLNRVLAQQGGYFDDDISPTWTPLGETLYEATRYFQQEDPYYSSGDYTVADGSNPERDPLYYASHGDKIWCAKNYVIIMTDGEATRDLNIPEYSPVNASLKVRDAYDDGCDDDACPRNAEEALRCGCPPDAAPTDLCSYRDYSTNCSASPFDCANPDDDNCGSAYLDDVAYYAHTTDLRSDLENEQTLSVYTVYFFGLLGTGDILLKQTAYNGGGEYKRAENASEIVTALEDIFEKITEQAAAAASTAITSEPVSGVDLLYIPYFKHPKEDQWWGNIRAFELDEDGNIINSSGAVAEDTDDDLVLDDPFWSATLTVKAQADADSRTFYTYLVTNGVSLLEFELSNISDIGLRFDVDLDGDATEDEIGTGQEANALMSYIRGDDNPSQANFDSSYTFREREEHYLGDIMHASPLFVGKPSSRFDLIYGDSSYWDFYQANDSRTSVLYAGINDAMLHCFNASTGEELWNFIPLNLLPHLKWLADPDYCHGFYVDLSTGVWDIKMGGTDWKSVLVGGMRLGGTPILADTIAPDIPYESSFFALDVTDPENPSLLWEQSSETLGYEFGYSTSKPITVKVEDTWYLVFGSGPKTRFGKGDPDDEAFTDPNAYIYIVNPTDGAMMRQISLGTTIGEYNFFGSPVAVDYDHDYSVDLIYIGDAKGNLWRIKTFTGSGASKTYVADQDDWIIDVDSDNPSVTEPDPLLSLGIDQPILMRPEVSMDSKGRLWIYVGTGRFLCYNDNFCCGSGVECPLDLVSGSCQAGYDVCSQTETINGSSETRSHYMAVGVFDRHWDTSEGKFVLQNSTLTTANLDHRVIITGTVQGTGGTGYAIVDATYPTLDIATDVCGTCQGWYFRLYEERERCIGDFLVYGGAVFFISYKPANDLNDPCTTGGVSYLYGVNYTSGTSTLDPLFDITGEGDIDTDDLVLKDGELYGPAIMKLENPFAGGSPKVKNNNLYTPLPKKPIKINPPEPTYSSGVTLWKEVVQ